MFLRLIQAGTRGEFVLSKNRLNKCIHRVNFIARVATQLKLSMTSSWENKSRLHAIDLFGTG